MTINNHTNNSIVLDDWDCVATCFFIDTAHNIIEYVERLWRILKPGGVWINFGPLLYHFEDIPNEASFELSYADLRSVILSFGFQIEVRFPPRSFSPPTNISF